MAPNQKYKAVNNISNKNRAQSFIDTRHDVVALNPGSHEHCLESALIKTMWPCTRRTLLQCGSVLSSIKRNRLVGIHQEWLAVTQSLELQRALSECQWPFGSWLLIALLCPLSAGLCSRDRNIEMSQLAVLPPACTPGKKTSLKWYTVQWTAVQGDKISCC